MGLLSTLSRPTASPWWSHVEAPTVGPVQLFTDFAPPPLQANRCTTFVFLFHFLPKTELKGSFYFEIITQRVLKAMFSISNINAVYLSFCHMPTFRLLYHRGPSFPQCHAGSAMILVITWNRPRRQEANYTETNPLHPNVPAWSFYIRQYQYIPCAFFSCLSYLSMDHGFL